MPDIVDDTVTFLAKRDGIDKTLKIIRYTSKLVLAGSVVSQDLRQNLTKLEGSIGTTRKALKLGKFLSGLKSLREVSPNDKHAALEIIALVGDTGYLFMEQIQWFIKMGIVDKRHSKLVTMLSAWSEFIGYMASISLCLIRQRESLEKEIALIRGAQQQKFDAKSDAETEKRLQTDLSKLYTARKFRTIGLLQDLADAFLALADIRESGKVLHDPMLLAAAGLLSGSLSAYTKWPGVKK